MANLPESSTFDAGVYQIELSDPVIGGPSGVSNAPLKNLANRTKYLKDHVDELESTRAPLASPEFTGTPKVPTATPGTNSTQAASTAFVKAAVDSKDLSGLAPLASPSFTGSPAAPTPDQFDADTSLATTAFVQRAIGSFSNYEVIYGAAVLNASHIGKQVLCYTNNVVNPAAYTVTLPNTSGIPDGAVVALFNAMPVSASVAVPAGVILGDGNAPTAVTLLPRDSAVFVKYSGEWRLHGGTAQLQFSTSARSNFVQAGEVSYFAFTTAPVGWLKANGAAVSRSTYSGLYAAIGTTFGAGDGSSTFNLPDLRGEFLRGWDDARGVDNSRGFGSWQNFMVESHAHLATTGNLAGARFGEGSMQYPREMTGQTSTTAYGGIETRPRNIALLACIKY